MIDSSIDAARRFLGPAGEGAKKLAPVGYFGKGALYVVIGLMALDASLNPGEGLEGAQEAIVAVRTQPLGIFAAGLMLIGLACYVLWQASRAVADPENRGDGLSGIMFRAVSLVVALIYGALVWQSVGVITGDTMGSEEAQAGARQLARFLTNPAGRIGVMAAGVAVMAYGLRQLYRSANATNFAEDQHPWLTRGGYVARGFISGLIGWFTFRGAMQYAPGEIRGLQGVLEALRRQPFGNGLIFAVGAGLLAYGVLQLFRARSWWRYGSG